MKTCPQYFFSKNRFPILFSIIVILAYGITVGWFSFYGDDWIFIYNYHLAGAQSFDAFTAWDRPFSAWVYSLSSALFQEHVLPYHILLLVQRWLSVLLFWKVLGKVWGESNFVVVGSTLLFAIYPGFQQQPISVQYIMHFSSLVLCLFSLYCMQKALHIRIKNGLRLKFCLWSIAGMICSLVALFTCEYFTGLEFIRPFLIWFILGQETAGTNIHSSANKAILVFKIWLPYIITTSIFLIWRVFIFSFQTYQAKFLDQFNADPFSAITGLVRKAGADLLTVSLRAYRNIIQLPAPESILPWCILFLLSCFICLICLRQISRSHSDNKKTLQILLTGIVAIFAAGIPFWITYIDVTVTYPWDRSTLSFSAGAALIFAALIDLLFKERVQTIVVAILTGLCVSFHFSNALVYKHEAAKMNDYFWQLAWRIPALEKGTILVSDDIPLDRYSDNDLTPIINWQYDPELRGLFYSYKYFDLDLREETYYSHPDTVQDVAHTYRDHQFYSSTDKTLGIYYRENNCLQTVSTADMNYPGLPDSLRHIAGISRIDLIETTPQVSAVPPAAIGKEPSHGYCYYFQKVSLALQEKDLDKAIDLADEALEQGLAPVNPADWMPLASAFLQARQYDKLSSLAEAINSVPENTTYFCNAVQSLDLDHSDSELADILISCDVTGIGR